MVSCKSIWHVEVCAILFLAVVSWYICLALKIWQSQQMFAWAPHQFLNEIIYLHSYQTLLKPHLKRRPIYPGPGCQTWFPKTQHSEILEYLFGVWGILVVIQFLGLPVFIHIILKCIEEVEKSQFFNFFKIKSLNFWPKVDMCWSKEGGRNKRSDGTKKNNATAEIKDTYLS